MRIKYQLTLQLIITLAILILAPGNLFKLFAFITLWTFTFKPISKHEFVFFFCVSTFFTIMNAISLKQGIFTFTHPDFLGMPYFELLMWGFYLLHTIRMLDGPIPKRKDYFIWALAILYSVCFATIKDQQVLFMATMLLLSMALTKYHEKMDLLYTFYMIFLGAAIEYSGVWTGQWFYPDQPPGGVPLWFITLWGGVGYLLRRLFYPMIAASNSDMSVSR